MHVYELVVLLETYYVHVQLTLCGWHDRETYTRAVRPIVAHTRRFTRAQIGVCELHAVRAWI